MFRASVRTFIEREVLPHYERWESAGIVDKQLFRIAGQAGFLGTSAPAELGGGGMADFRFNAVIVEEACRAGVYPSLVGIHMQNDITLPYFMNVGNDEQHRRWLPGICSGELVTAIAMTEPGAGSDLAGIRTTAWRDGDDYEINGAKTFISNAINCDLVIVVCKTDPSQRHRGISLVVVESDRPGFERGANLAKVGQHSADTGELFFNDLRVPIANRLGEEGSGFSHLDGEPRSRALNGSHLGSRDGPGRIRLGTLDYAKQRFAFGQPIGSFQYNRFRLAEMRTELDLAEIRADEQVRALNEDDLDSTDAAESKWWCTELCLRVVDACVQLHGGYGYMEEYPIARAWRDARIMTIYGGTTEIMKEIVGRSLGVERSDGPETGYT